jgi:hypothetical protein
MPPARFERTTPGLGILCSIHLSYGGAWNISSLQNYFSSPVSNCALLCPETGGVTNTVRSTAISENAKNKK